jgi:pimeloyl-ACP methyl ester carboxylesterase
MAIYYPAARQGDNDVIVAPPSPGFADRASSDAAKSAGSASILKLCNVQWPVVLFMHGHIPLNVINSAAVMADHYRSWSVLGSTLAKAGFVVVMPSHGASSQASDDDVNAALRDVEWVRRSWIGAPWVDQGKRLAVAAHSNGCFVALRIARDQPDVTSLTMLGPQFQPIDPVFDEFKQLNTPRRFGMYGEGLSFEQYIGDLLALGDPASLYVASYQGKHFDYVPSSAVPGLPQGPCPLIGQVTADLLTLFIAGNLGPYQQVPVVLTAPEVPPLSAVQRSYAGNYLRFADVACTAECSVDLKWNVGWVQGARHLGPTGSNPAPCVQG